MRSLWLAAAIGLALTGGAQATSSISCADSNGNSVDLGLGSVPGMAIISAVIEADGTQLSMVGEQLSVSQAFADGDSIRIDFTDTNFEGVLARVRLFQTDEADDYAMAGTLEVIGVGAYAVICEGP